MFRRLPLRQWFSLIMPSLKARTPGQLVALQAQARTDVRARIERALDDGPFGWSPDRLYAEWVLMSEYQATLDVSLENNTFLPTPSALNEMRPRHVSSRGFVAFFIPLNSGGDGAKKITPADEPAIRSLYQVHLPHTAARDELLSIMKTAIEERLERSKLPCTLERVTLEDRRRVDAVSRWVDGVEAVVQLKVSQRALDVYEKAFKD